jgi:hypothetical protein
MNHTGKTCNIVQRPTDHHEYHISGICNNTKAATAATFHVYQQTLSNLSSTVSTLPKKNAILESIGILEVGYLGYLRPETPFPPVNYEPSTEFGEAQRSAFASPAQNHML